MVGGDVCMCVVEFVIVIGHVCLCVTERERQQCMVAGTKCVRWEIHGTGRKLANAVNAFKESRLPMYALLLLIFMEPGLLILAGAQQPWMLTCVCKNDH